MFKLEW